MKTVLKTTMVTMKLKAFESNSLKNSSSVYLYHVYFIIPEIRNYVVNCLKELYEMFTFQIELFSHQFYEKMNLSSNSVDLNKI